MKIKIIAATLLLSTAFYSHADGAFTPFLVGDMSPLTTSYGAPRDTSPAQLREGQWQWQLGVNISNTLHVEKKAKYSEVLQVDSESSRHELRLGYGLSDRWDLRFALPFIQHEAGSLDDFIDDFHQALGFPEGDRPTQANDQFTIRYDREGQTLINITQPQSGIGDASLALVGNFTTEYEHLLSLGIKLKFPTGDSVGSDTLDVAVWATAGNELAPGLSHFVSAGLVSVEGDKGLLADLRKSNYGFLRYGLNWQLTGNVDLKLQLDTQSDVYKNTETRLLGHSSSLSLGGTLHMPRQWDLDIAVVEDIDVGTAADVVFHFNVRKRFGY